MPRARPDIIQALTSSDPRHVERGLSALRERLLSGSTSAVQELASKETELLHALTDLAEDEAYVGVSPSPVAQCLAIYGIRCNALSAVWEQVLPNVSTLVPIARLRAHIHLTREIFAADGATLRGAFAKDVLEAFFQVLQTTARTELLPSMVKAFCSIALLSPQHFADYFRDIVDLLLGWSVDAHCEDKNRDLINEAFVTFRPHWSDEANAGFALGLQRKLLTDIRKVAKSAREAMEEIHSQELEMVPQGWELHALLSAFSGIVASTATFPELHEHATYVLVQCADFFVGVLPLLSGLALRDVKLCLQMLSAWWQAAGSGANTGVLSEVLRSAKFSHLRLVLDAEVRTLMLKLYDTLFRYSSPQVTEIAVAALTEEFHTLARTAEVQAKDTASKNNLTKREAEALIAADLAVMQRSVLSLAVLRASLTRVQGKSARSLLLSCIWDAAGRKLSSKEETGADSLDGLVSEFEQALQGGDSQHILKAIRSSSSVLWMCFSAPAQASILAAVWSSWRCGVEDTASRETLLDIALEIFPAGKPDIPSRCLQIYLASLQPEIESLMDPCGVLASCNSNEARVLALYAELRGVLAEWAPTLAGKWEADLVPKESGKQPRQLMAPHLRSLIPQASQLSPNAVHHLMSSLRSASGNPGDHAALSFATLAAPSEVAQSCSALWMLLLAASYFVSHRLKSPYGQASTTLASFESLVIDCLAAVGAATKAFLREASGLSKASSSRDVSVLRRHRPTSGITATTPHTYQPLACVQLVHMLEQLILLAQHPVHVATCPQAPLTSKEVSKFFEGNSKVCADWFYLRMRGLVREALSRHGSAPAHYMVSSSLLAGWLKQAVPSIGETPLSVQTLIENSSARTPGSGLPGASALGLADGFFAQGRGEGGEGRVTVLADNSHALEALELNLIPVLASAVAMRSAGLCRGIFTLYQQVAPKLGCTALPICQDAFLAFTAQNYEEAAELFSSTAKLVQVERARPQQSRHRSAAQGSSSAVQRQPLRALVAKTWLDAAVLARSSEQVERWLTMYEDAPEVSNAMRSFAAAFMHLVRFEYTACRTAAASAIKAASDDVTDFRTLPDQNPGPDKNERRYEIVCRLSSWSDLSSALLVDASAAAKLSMEADNPTTIVNAFAQAKSCLHADVAARAHCEPYMASSVVSRSGLEVWEPQAAMLGLLNRTISSLTDPKASAAPPVQEHQTARAWLDNSTTEVASPPATPIGMQSALHLTQLHYAAAFHLPVKIAEADKLQLVGQCLHTKNMRLAATLLDEVDSRSPDDTGDTALEMTLLRSVLLEGQHHVPQAFQRLHEKLDTVLGMAARHRIEQVQKPFQGPPGLDPADQWLSSEFLKKTSIEKWFTPPQRAEKVALLIAKHSKLLQSRSGDIFTQRSRSSSTGATLPQALIDMQLRMQEAHACSADALSQSLFTTAAISVRSGEGQIVEPFLQESITSGAAQLNPMFVGWQSLQGCLLCPNSSKLWSRYGDWLHSQRMTLEPTQIEDVVTRTLGTETCRAHSDSLRNVCRAVRNQFRKCSQRMSRQRHLPSRDNRRSTLWPTADTFSSEWLADRGSGSKSHAAWQTLGPSIQQKLAVAFGDFSVWLQRWQVLVAREGLRAYARQLSLEDGATAGADPRLRRNLLRVLRLLEALPEDDSGAISEATSPLTGDDPVVPAKMWEPLLPQILAYMKHPSRSMSALATELFSGLVRSSPCQTIFPALAAEPCLTGGADTAAPAQSASMTALQIVRNQQPEMARNAEQFSKLVTAMATPLDETCARCVQLAVSLLAPRTGMDAIDAIAIIIARFSSLLQQLDAACGEGMSAILSGPPPGFPPGLPVPGGDQVDVLAALGAAPALDTAYARKFLVAFLPALRQMVFQTRHYLRVPMSTVGMGKLRVSVLHHLQSLMRVCAHFARISTVQLQDIAPALAAMFEIDQGASAPSVVLPLRSAAVSSGPQLFTISRVRSKVQMLSTKTKPKRIEVEATDGSSHVFLLKGREDLRLDEQIMQLLQAVNSIINSEPTSATLSSVQGSLAYCPPVPLRCRDYDVLPIAPRAGLIRWVQAVPLFTIHKLRRQSLNAQRAEKVGEEKKHFIMESSTDVWHLKVQMHLRNMGVDPIKTPRRNWPPEALRKTFDEMQADSPADLLSRELMLSSLNPSEHFVKSVAITQSMAMMSVLGHIVGLGDRHLDNILLDLATGEVIHVDYSLCFDRGARLKVPERVPFRLTRCMVAALGPTGVSGLFHQTMVASLGFMREWRELLLSLVEPCFLLAPINDWVHPLASPFRIQDNNASPATRRNIQNAASGKDKEDRHEMQKETGGLTEPPTRQASTEAGTTGESDDDSSPNEESANEDGNEDEDEAMAGQQEATTEEGHLAQDTEEMEETPLVQLKKEEPEANASGDDDDVSEEGDEDRGEGGAAWSANSEACSAVHSISRKIPRSSTNLNTRADHLLVAATHPDDLAQMYEGWTAWI